jgi:hypothetical protein
MGWHRNADFSVIEACQIVAITSPEIANRLLAVIERLLVFMSP